MDVGIIGAGAMGKGIAQVAAVAGHQVVMFDARGGAAVAAVGRVGQSLDRQVEKGRLTASERDAAAGRLRVADSLEAFSDCGLVIEAIVEDLTVKQAVFAELEEVVAEACVLATNTSSLSIGAVCKDLRRPERSLGLHFFNPPHVMKLVEVVAGPRTTDATVEYGVQFARGLGKQPVVARDTPGFIVNLAGRAYTTEALHIVAEGVATPVQVDRIMCDNHRFPMGPFELMDLTGVDVNYPVTQNIFEHHFAEPMLRSTWEHRYHYEAGLLGQKTGRGFHDHTGSAPADTGPAVPPAPGVAPAVVLGSQDQALREFCVRNELRVVEDDGVSAVLVAPVGEDVTLTADRLGLDLHRTVGVDLAFGAVPVVTVAVPPGVAAELFGPLHGHLAARQAVEVVNDSPGFVGQRIIAAVVNLGCQIAQQGVATPEDIDLAVQLGLRYPAGPLALGEQTGPEVISQILTGMHTTTGDPRYRTSGWLRRRTAARLPLHHPDHANVPHLQLTRARGDE